MTRADLARRRRIQLVAAYQRWRRTLDDDAPPSQRPRTAPAPLAPVRGATPDRRPPL